ncbi:hypothetical protein [Corynebacterium mastitidis]|uniref:hypothetical protein n=1 Tax=Corynebacterium mastitidis TaxID=161890 RepID=UPI0003AA339E|nr:hypothetical protein [Corynebacterium mastitidis]
MAKFSYTEPPVEREEGDAVVKDVHSKMYEDAAVDQIASELRRLEMTYEVTVSVKLKPLKSQ